MADQPHSEITPPAQPQPDQPPTAEALLDRGSPEPLQQANVPPPQPAAAGAQQAPLPWYHAGLQFQCSQCGDCCTGAPGYVWVNKAEIEALAARMNVSVEEFQEKYTRKVGIRTTLIELANYDCVFFDGLARKCTVYEDRPRQCRTWPFWDSNIRDEAAWKRTCEVCPGSGQGPVVPLSKIQQQLVVIRI